MKLGNAAEQLEAALLDAMIDARCRACQAEVVSKEFSVDENGQLVANVTIIPKKAVDNIVINLNMP